jgi:hypothetical protein
LGFDTPKQLILTALWVTIGILLNYIGAVLMDRVGRVMLLCKYGYDSKNNITDKSIVIGFIGCTFVLMMVPVLLSQYQGTGNSSGLSAAVFFIFAHIGLYISLLIL